MKKPPDSTNIYFCREKISFIIYANVIGVVSETRKYKFSVDNIEESIIEFTSFMDSLMEYI